MLRRANAADWAAGRELAGLLHAQSNLEELRMQTNPVANQMRRKSASLRSSLVSGL
jgi:hypothetical protein